MRILIGGIVLLLCFGLVNGLAQDEWREIKGIVIAIDLKSSANPQHPTPWPFLLIQNEPNMLVGKADILEELSYLLGREVVLKAKELPQQKFEEKEYNCFEVSDIEKMDGQFYLTGRNAIAEFRQALEAIEPLGLIDNTGKQAREGSLKSVWFDKNKNNILDAGDRLFITSRSAGKSDKGYLTYPSHAIIRQYKNGKIYYYTFVLKDPFPQNSDPAIMGRLKYDTEKDAYLMEVNKIHYKGADDIFLFPKEEDRVVILKKNDALKPFVNKEILLVGDNYQTIFWYGDSQEDITRNGGEYFVTAKGKLSFAKFKYTQEPWGVSLVKLKDNRGKIYELRRLGYVGSWNDLIDKEISVTGALRPLMYYGRKPVCVLEVVSVN